MNSSSTGSPALLALLHEDDFVSADTVARLQVRVADAWRPLGGVLRQRGILTTAQMLHLLQVQSSAPHLLFGDIAIREGFCTEADVRAAVKAQESQAPHLLDLLAGDETCDHARLCGVLIRYVKQLEEQARPD